MIMQASHYSGGVEVRPGCGGHVSMVVQFILSYSLLREGFKKKKSMEISIKGGGSNPFHTFSIFFFFLVKKSGV